MCSVHNSPFLGITIIETPERIIAKMQFCQGFQVSRIKKAGNKKTLPNE